MRAENGNPQGKKAPQADDDPLPTCYVANEIEVVCPRQVIREQGNVRHRFEAMRTVADTPDSSQNIGMGSKRGKEECLSLPDSGFHSESGWENRNREPSEEEGSWNSPLPPSWLRYNRGFGRIGPATRLFDSEESVSFIPKAVSDFFKGRPHEILSVLVFFIVVASSVVSICTLNNGLYGEVGFHSRNGKYRSIEFAHSRKLNLTKREAITDEEGLVLGGKKASIQFGHDMAMVGETEKVEGQANAPKANPSFDEAVKILDGIRETAELVESTPESRVQAEFRRRTTSAATLQKLQSFVRSRKPNSRETARTREDILKQIQAVPKSPAVSSIAEKKTAIDGRKRTKSPKTPNANPLLAFKKRGFRKISYRAKDEEDPFRFV